MTTPFSLSLPPARPHPDLDEKFQYLSISILKSDPFIHVVALDRPRKINAMNSKLWKEIGMAFSTIGTLGDGCRCVLLVGNGKSFSSGIDITDPAFSLPDEEDAARRGVAFRAQILEMQRCFTALERCPVPVVAAVHGNCIGGGIDLICSSDIRFCSSETLFAVREPKLGLAADVGTLQRFPKIVGFGSRVRELCMTGEDFCAEEALRIGFVSAVASSPTELISIALASCRKIAANSPIAVCGTKLSLNFSRDHSVAEGLEHVAMHNSMALQTDDMMTSFMAAKGGPSPSFAKMLPHSRL